MNITVVGAGYVGLSTAVHLAETHNVTALDVSQKIVDSINKRECHLKESALAEKLKDGKLNIKATIFPEEAYKECECAIIAVPTNFDEEHEGFDTRILDSVVETAVKLSRGTIVIKSTAPIGYTQRQIDNWHTDRIVFSPEFMREGKSLFDVSNPSRIIVGAVESKEGMIAATQYAEMMLHASKNHPETAITRPSEAEAIKLFSNCYLAMRVAFFNELDAFAEIYGLKTKDIITGMCMDPRIGKGYNNPSFGFGGYCLPKDTKQLASQIREIPGCLIRSIADANDIRIKNIAERAALFAGKFGVIGIYGLSMKAGSDNARASAVVHIAQHLVEMGRRVIVYDPLIKCEIDGAIFIEDENEFLEQADVILVNRLESNKLLRLEKKIVYTRDVFGTS